MIKKLFISLGYFFAYLLVAILLLTIFNYFKLFGMGFIKILKFLLLILGIMIFSYLLGKKSVKNGYLEGAKFGGSIVFVFLLFGCRCIILLCAICRSSSLYGSRF